MSKLIIHGGFFSESNTDESTKKLKQESLRIILDKSFEYLKTHSAYETVIYAVSLLEDDPLYNAGIGSQIQSDGEIRMSAAVMDGETQLMSGVINIQHVKNPIKVAEFLNAYDDRILGGPCATEFARNNGFEFFSVETEQRRKEFEEKLKSTGSGTVGCVAIDAEGKLAAATSTGGKGFEIPGRISDSATIAGNYANQFCAVSCTGVGEDIVSGAVAAKIVTRLTDGFSMDKAFEKTFEELKIVDGFAGAIAIDKDGNIFHLDSHPTMVFGAFDGKNYEIFS
jgi:L-asparaginase